MIALVSACCGYAAKILHFHDSRLWRVRLAGRREAGCAAMRNPTRSGSTLGVGGLVQATGSESPFDLESDWAGETTMNKDQTIAGALGQLYQAIGRLDQHVGEIGRQLEQLSGRINGLGSAVDRLTGEVSGLSTKIDRRFDTVQERVDTRAREVREDMVEVRGDVARIEKKLDAYFTRSALRQP